MPKKPTTTLSTKFLNYLIVIQPDKRTGTGEFCYSVYCPSLGLADSGDTIEEAITNIEHLIEFHLECLKEEGDIFVEDDRVDNIIATARVKVRV